MAKININLNAKDFGDMFINEIDAILLSFNAEIQERVNDAVREVADEGKEILKKNSPKNTGEYAKGWTTSKKTWKRRTEIGKGYYYYSPIYVTKATIYNKNRPTLTHLLEYGHDTRNGGHTKPQPHIVPTSEDLEELLVEKVIENLQEK